MEAVVETPYKAKATTTYNEITQEISNAVVVKWKKEEPYTSLVVDENGVKYFATQKLAQQFAKELNDSLGVKDFGLPDEFFVPCSKRNKSKAIKLFQELDIDPDPDFENIWYGHTNGFYVKNCEFNMSILDEEDDDGSIPILKISELKSLITSV